MNITLVKMEAILCLGSPCIRMTLRVQRPRGNWNIEWCEDSNIDFLPGSDGLHRNERREVLRRVQLLLSDPSLAEQLRQVRDRKAELTVQCEEKKRQKKRQHEEEERQRFIAAKPIRDAEYLKRFKEAAAYLARETGASLDELHRILDEAVAESVMEG